MPLQALHTLPWRIEALMRECLVISATTDDPRLATLLEGLIDQCALCADVLPALIDEDVCLRG